MTEIKVFYEINPGKDQKCCSNCVHWSGMMYVGYCSFKRREKMANQHCRKNFVKETEERKQEKML